MSFIKCSVIMPTFNREATILRSLQYFDRDFYLTGEVIVVDDASSDRTCALIEREFPSVKLLKHSNNQGVAAARNTGIKFSQGKYIAFLDSDDIWYPNKLLKQLYYFETLDSKIGAVFSAYHYNKGKIRTRTFNKVDDWFQYFLKGCFISPGSGLVVRRSVFDEIGFFDENMRRLEDWDWLLRLSQHHSLSFINDPLFGVNYSGKPDSKIVLEAIEMLKNKWLENLSDKHKISFNTTLTIEKLIAVQEFSDIFLKTLFLDIIRNPNIFLGLFSRMLF